MNNERFAAAVRRIVRHLPKFEPCQTRVEFESADAFCGVFRFHDVFIDEIHAQWQTSGFRLQGGHLRPSGDLHIVLLRDRFGIEARSARIGGRYVVAVACTDGDRCGCGIA
jgi:hypothetical protein